LPGRDPHPTRDPEGHSHGAEERPADYFAPERWRENEDYLFGVDLYNHGYLWEAHEAWEGLWHRAKHDTAQALYLQGLIQCAAASLKIPMGQPRGLERLTSLGTEKLERALAEPAPDSVRPGYMGLDVAAFVESMREFAASSPATNEARPRLELE
jgi:hypothetical protein